MASFSFGYPDPALAWQLVVPTGGGHSGYVVQARVRGSVLIEEATRIPPVDVSAVDDGSVQVTWREHELVDYLDSQNIVRPWVGLAELVGDDDRPSLRYGLRPEADYERFAIVLDPAYDATRTDPVSSRAVHEHLDDLRWVLTALLMSRR